MPQTFQTLEGLRPELHRALDSMGHTTPTQVQREAYPAILSNRDVIVQSKTGSGKTLAFGIPLLNQVEPDRLDVQVLVITPTRELALQVNEQLNRAGSYLHVGSLPVYGGSSVQEQITQLKYGTHVVVGTPGRLCDFLERKVLRLDHCRAVVLDEADEMLDMGFRKDLEYILWHLPAQRQTVLCSATMPPEIRAIANQYMHDPVHITVQPGEATPQLIRHRLFRVPSASKFDTLLTFLKREKPPLTMLFCRTKLETKQVGSRLLRAGFDVGILHGDMTQDQREIVMQQFREGRCNFLVSTDVAARGIDVDHVSHVIHYSVPHDPETYIHRSGRTGRIGRSGNSVIFVAPEEQRNFVRVEKLIPFEVGSLEENRSMAKVTVADEAEDVKEKPTRRRRTPAKRTKVAAEPEGPEETAEAVEAEAVEAIEAPAVEEEAPAPTRRRRAPLRRKAAAVAPVVEEEETEEEAAPEPVQEEAVVEAEAVSLAEEEAAEEEGEEEAAVAEGGEEQPRRRRRRRLRRGGRDEGVYSDAQNALADTEPRQVPVAVSASTPVQAPAAFSGPRPGVRWPHLNQQLQQLAEHPLVAAYEPVAQELLGGLSAEKAIAALLYQLAVRQNREGA